MKNTLLSCLLLMGTLFSALAQTGFEAHNLALDLKHKPGEVIVKFKDEIKINFTKSSDLVQTGLAEVDQAFEKWSVSSSEQLFRAARYERNAGTIRFPDGTVKPITQFHNIFLMKYPEKFNPEQVAEELNKLEEVEYAEVNATAFIHGLIPVSEPFKAEDLGDRKNHSERSLVPNDPLYDQQWYLPEVKADQMWDTLTGDSTQVIAILDTGVDWLHPDLVNKIGTNPNETIDGQDSDGNGFVDDLRGWDFVNNDNNPMDDNSHGTHCAGIAAAESDNGIGIAGVSWGAKIMPVKIFQSNGVGYVNQIAEGIWYAAQNGANIFSNSWGGYGESITVRLAFEYAYSKGPIIAAAGNSYFKIDHPTPPLPPTAQMFPASYNWVLGVEATSIGGENAWFSNFDPTGPVVSDGRPYDIPFFNDFDWNYEARIPGSSILSTIPNDQYQYYNGTSMAAPIVSGAIALIKSVNPNLSMSNEEVFARLIQLNKIDRFHAGIIDIKKSALNIPPPDLYFKGYSISDSIGDNDGRVDAGETIALYIDVKNAGGHIQQVTAKIQFDYYEDTTTVNMIQDSIFVGSIGTYGTKTSTQPFLLAFNPDLANGRWISMNIVIYHQFEEQVFQEFANLDLVVEKGEEIAGFYTSLHLKPDRYYIVKEPAAIDTLIIDPGVTLNFSSNTYLLANTELTAIGKPDSMITFRGDNGARYRGITMGPGCNDTFEYCIFEDGYNEYGQGSYLTNPSKVHHCIFRNNPLGILFGTVADGDYKYNVFYENNYYAYGNRAIIEYWANADFKYNILMNNYCGNPPHDKGSILMFYSSSYPENMERTKHNVFMNNTSDDYSFDVGLGAWNGLPVGNYAIDTNYWGTTNIPEIESHILDYYEYSVLPILTVSNPLESPPEDCHGLVWKVLINGQESTSGDMVTIGAEVARFDVIFNRPMDTNYLPLVNFGVRYPYTQHMITDSARWSSDSLIWTAYYTFSLSDSDGVNTLRIGNARDLDHFEIPIERTRFKFNLQVAGSESIEFNADAGIGKVDLTWSSVTGGLLLGHNLYRYSLLEDGLLSDTILLNENLILGTSFTDYDVVPGITYKYFFTHVLTDFSESDISKVATAIPLGSTIGDANGDSSVNVSDIITVINYMFDQNPQPFLFAAADINTDADINVIDIVGIVQLILGSKSTIVSSDESGDNDNAFYFFKDNSIYLMSIGDIAALQFSLKKISPIESHLSILKDSIVEPLLDDFEFVFSVKDDKYTGLVFSLSDRKIPSGEIELFSLSDFSINDSLEFDIFGSSIKGEYIDIHEKIINDVNSLKNQKTGPAISFKPNPFKASTSVLFEIAENGYVKIDVISVEGYKVITLLDDYLTAGEHEVSWNGVSSNGKLVSSGLYFVRIESRSDQAIKSTSVSRVMFQK